MTDQTPTTAVDARPEYAAQGTQIANPGRATLRTFVQSAVGLVLIANTVVPMLLDSLKTLPEGVVPGWVFVTLNGIAVATALLIALVARIMASPVVNSALEQYLPWLAALKRQQ